MRLGLQWFISLGRLGELNYLSLHLVLCYFYQNKLELIKLCLLVLTVMKTLVS